MAGVPVYEIDPYRTELAVEIVEVGSQSGRRFVILDDTILFPEGGGQPADFGWLDETPIADVKRDETVVRHFVDRALQPGRAQLRLDWSRRFDHMQQHTAQHLLTSIALRDFGWNTLWFHIGPVTSDIELYQPLAIEQVLALEEAVARMVRPARFVRGFRVSVDEYADLQVRSRGLPANHSGDIRLVEIEDLEEVLQLKLDQLGTSRRPRRC